MGSLARKMRRTQLVRANSRDEVLIRTAQRVDELEQVLYQVIQALNERGIMRAEAKTESGLIVPQGPVK